MESKEKEMEKISAKEEKEKKKPKKKKRKWKLTKQDKKLIAFSILLIGIFLCVDSSIHLYTWYKDSKEIQNLTEEINDNVTIEEVKEDTNTNDSNSQSNVEVIEPKEKPKTNNPYWDYIKMSLIDVDFSKLEKTNSDVVGWIQVNGTNINYPFVQTNDNEYYLTHSFNKSRNSAGWVFLDYRNDITTLDQNNILYAHARLDNTMFGSLKNILKNNWYKNTDNHIIKLSTKYQNTLWQVFSIYHIPTTNDYLTIDFSSEEEFKKFASMLQKRSKYKFDTTVSGTDKILTLSTCYSNNEKLVIHAKLIKIQNK